MAVKNKVLSEIYWLLKTTYNYSPFYVIENKFGPLSERLVTDLANTEWITIKESYFLLILLPGVIYSRYYWNRGGWLNSQLNYNKKHCSPTLHSETLYSWMESKVAPKSTFKT